MPEAEVVSSLGGIARAQWDRCFPGELESYDYLYAVEQSGIAGFQWRYVVVREGGALVAACPAFLTLYRLDTTLTGPGKQIAQALRRRFPGALSLTLACIGSPCTETVGAGFAPGLGDDAKCRLLCLMLEGFERHAAEAGCGLLGVKDVAQSARALWDAVLQPMGYSAIAGLPSATLDVDFRSIEDYLHRLSAATRKDMRRKLKKTSIRVEHRTDLADALPRVMALYRQTRQRAEMQFEELTADYFLRVLADMPGRAFCALYFVGDELLAANLLLRDERALLDKFFCMDAERGRRHDLYFLSWFHNVQFCLDQGLQAYRSGQAEYGVKLRLGSRLTPTSMYFRHRNAALNRALRLAAPLFAVDQPSVRNAA